VRKGAYPIAVSLSVILVVTTILWGIKLNTTGSHHLVYFYLVPIVLIAVLYDGRTAILCTAIALVGADYFLEDPIYSLIDDDPREFGDLVWFALLAVTAIKFVRELARRAKSQQLAADRRPGPPRSRNSRAPATTWLSSYRSAVICRAADGLVNARTRLNNR